MRIYTRSIAALAADALFVAGDLMLKVAQAAPRLTDRVAYALASYAEAR